MITDNQERIREVFATFKDEDAKWQYLISLAKSYKEEPGLDKSDEYIVPGCSTTMYLVPKYEAGLLYYYIGIVGTGTTPLISLGLAELAVQVYSGNSPRDILDTDKSFFNEIGLTVGLTPTRNNGFASILDRIYKTASIYSMIFSK